MAVLEQTREEAAALAAGRLVGDLAYRFLLNSDEPERMGEILAALNRSLNVPPKALKLIITDDPRIVPADKQYAVAHRNQENHWTIERSIIELIGSAGQPMAPAQIGRELSHTISRAPSALSDMVIRMVSARRDYFLTPIGEVGLMRWLLDTQGENEQELIFDNFESQAAADMLEELRADARACDWSDPVAGAVQLLERAAAPVPNRVLQFFEWTLSPNRVSPQDFFNLLYGRSELALLSNLTWIGPRLRAACQSAIEELEQTGAGVELRPEDLPKPVSVEAEDIQALQDLLASSHGIERVDTLIQQQFQIHPHDLGHEQVHANVVKALRSNGRFQWVGWDRWRLAAPVPSEVQETPALLEPVYVDIEGPGGQRIDVELEDEGLEGTLAEDIRKPAVALGGQADLQPDKSIRCTINYWTREAGLLPVDPAAKIFPAQPDLVLIETVDEAGERREHWYNNQMGYAFGFGAWYKAAGLPQSGGVFILRPTDAPGAYEIAATKKHDKSLYIEAGRLKDIRALRTRAETQETSTLEIVQELMGEYSKGVDFVELFSEVVVARQSSPRLIASILSAYYCFYPKAGLWHFNERDVSKGFKKTKKKYMRKR